MLTLYLLLIQPALVLAAPPSPTFPKHREPCLLPDTYSEVSTTTLPDPWKFIDGKPVSTAADFTCRQREISRIFQQFELGDLPPAPDSLTPVWAETGTSMNITVAVGSKSVTWSVRMVPSALDNNAAPASQSGSAAIIALGGSLIPVPSSIHQIIFNNDECAFQAGQGSRGRGKFYDLHGSSHSAGSLMAWAWCVGRIIDALEQLGAAKTGINPSRLGVTGCSRNGKGAFVVGAFEKRIALTIPQESGGGGAACWRMMNQEIQRRGRPRNCCQCGAVEPGCWSDPTLEATWFARKFNWRSINSVPADHHFLAALVAPRGLYVIENNIDYVWPWSTTGCMKAGRMVYSGIGVQSSMGFSMIGGHNHCQFPASGQADLFSFMDQFLLHSGRANDVDTSQVTNSYLSSFIAGWSQAPNITHVWEF
ncbi:4-O-methyl-glucuronoyl methylesterase [Triangularia setosa]|uniref:(4-O-methyl)-D-glucuronate--lignin esterase n=1 Tax=Triangularia setosa TaxID=2587417 RepID=A0AAN7A9B9_9PEZI|nr:4-O-methyl-glucuronoyl methylesterase [Podospora setosa]